jgi:uncharacterized phiE125 gp8 family phage protein
MALVLTSGPALEPITVAEAKAHMRIDGTAEDVLIASLILTARLHLEAALDLAFITQSWTLVMDTWGRGPSIDIPLSPLLSINAVRVKTGPSTTTLIPATSYVVDIASRPARLVWNATAKPEPYPPANGIEIDFTAGFGASAAPVPAPLRHALLLLTAHWYEHRDPGEIGSNEARVPAAISDLIQPFRKIRL